MLKLIKDLGKVYPPENKYPRYLVLVECSSCGIQYEMNKATYKQTSASSVCKTCSKSKLIKYTDTYILNTIKECDTWKEFMRTYPHLYKIVVTRDSLSEIKNAHRIVNDELKMVDNMRGIYFLYQDDEIVYIGKSTVNIRSRLLNHITQREKYKKFNKIVCYEISSLADLHIAEIYLINKHTPLYNSDLKEGDMTLTIPNIDSIIKKEVIIHTKSEGE